MESYRYYVYNIDGKVKKGIIRAGDRQQAMAILKNEGNTVISLDEAGIWFRDLEMPLLRRRVSERDMSVFCRQFVTLLDAGISIVRALEMMEEQTENKALKEALGKTHASVKKGQTLADSMKIQPRVFSSMLVSLVQAGEETGRLTVSFERMAGYFEKTEKMNNIVKKAVVYPAILSVVALIVVIVMLTCIVPMYNEMFADMNVQFPVYTRFVVNLSSFVIRFRYLLLIALILIIMGIKAFANTEGGRYLLSVISIKLPILGNLKKKNTCAQFSRNLSTLLGAGVSIIEALEITSDTLDNLVYKRVLRGAKEQVVKGIQLSVPLQESGIFPPMVYHMVGIGEETGDLPGMLGKVADYYEEEVVAATEQAAAAIEPLIIVLMAIVVIAVIGAIFTPMLSLYSNIEYL